MNVQFLPSEFWPFRFKEFFVPRPQIQVLIQDALLFYCTQVAEPMLSRATEALLKSLVVISSPNVERHSNLGLYSSPIACYRTVLLRLFQNCHCIRCFECQIDVFVEVNLSPVRATGALSTTDVRNFLQDNFLVRQIFLSLPCGGHFLRRP